MTPLNDGYTYRELIDGRAAGQPLDRYLSGRYTHSSHAQWCEHIDAGRVLIDGARVEATAVLRSGQELEWRRAPWREPDAPLTLSVLYDEGGVLVVGKPAGLPTLPGGGFLQHTLLHQLRLVAATASPLHRLGRWTSGAVLCARSPSVAAALTAQFAARSIRKRYRALAAGQPSEDCFETTPERVPWTGPVADSRMRSAKLSSASGLLRACTCHPSIARIARMAAARSPGRFTSGHSRSIGPLVESDVAKKLELLQDLAGADRDRAERVVADYDGEAGPLREQPIQASEHRSAARQHDALVDDVRSELGGGALEGAEHRLHDELRRLGHGVTDLV